MKGLKISGVLLYLFGLVLVLLLYFYYVFTPLTGKVAQLDAEHTQNTAQLQMFEQQIQKKDELKNKISAMQSELDNLNRGTSVSGKNVAEDIGTACSSSGVTPDSIQVGNETVIKGKSSSNGDPLCSVIVNLQTVCTDAQLLQLLNYFEGQSKGAYFVNSVSYSWGQDKSLAGLTLTLYYFGSEAAKG